METEVCAGVIIYRRTRSGIKFLLLYHGGRYWNFPKGHATEGEKSFAAAIREVREETGLGQSDMRFLDWFRVQDRFVVVKNHKEVLKVVSYYLAETANPRVKISKEHQGYGWFLCRDALHFLIHQNLRTNLKRACDIIAKRYPENEDTQRTGKIAN